MLKSILAVSTKSTCAITAALVLGLSGPTAIANAMEKPVFNFRADVAPADGTPGPPVGDIMEQNTECAVSAVLANSQFRTIPVNTVWDTTGLHKFASGKGVSVAVIDSGVNPNPRLTSLTGGGDYVMGGNGLSDCDHHGTLVAGLIAAQPSRTDGFVGVAPDAHIISIREFSSAFSPKNKAGRKTEEQQKSEQVYALAQSIVHAADLGAKVINISITVCTPVESRPDVINSLYGALYYAAVKKDAVVVTSAGNTGDSCGTNPGPSPEYPADTRGWSTVANLSLPSLFSDLVLSVGGSTLTGDPYVNSMPGPWVGVAAPAVNIVSLSPVPSKTQLINAQLVKGVAKPINGTSFSSALVSGLVALLREKYPKLTAHQIINRIENTAHQVDSTITSVMGAGNVDPMSALTADIRDSAPLAENVPPIGVAMAPPPPPADTLPRTLALAIAGGAVIFLIFAGALYTIFSRKTKLAE